jgi:small subunit ribosomal protein S11
MRCIGSRRALSTTTRSSAREEGHDDLNEFMDKSLKRNRQNSPLTQYNAAQRSTRSDFDDALGVQKNFDLFGDDATRNLDASRQGQGAHRFHVYATKHNTHITLVQPPRPASETASLRLAGAKTNAADQKKMVDTLMSLSAGNIGFKKAGRGSYDAGFQLAAFVLRQMTEKGMMRNMKGLQVVLRGFGAGREAVTKALLGSEGRIVRKHITSVVDATRLKQGGPRGKKPRRLG